MSTPSSSSSSASPGSSASDAPPIAKVLEQRSMEIIRSINDLTFRYVFPRYASNDFIGARELIAGSVSGFNLDTTVGHVEGFGRTFPNYQIDPMPASVDIDERNGVAAVWITCFLSRGPGNLEKETVSIFYWRRDALGKWECNKHTLLNGMPPIPR